jgi:hypothetical protein
MASCYAFCSSVAHGQTGWTGPVRTGNEAAQLANEDAEQHRNENPTHEPSVSCSEQEP